MGRKGDLSKVLNQGLSVISGEKMRKKRVLILCVLLVLAVGYAGYDYYQKIKKLEKSAIAAASPLRILIEEGESTCPAIVIVYAEGLGLSGEQVIVCVWRYGRVVWSKDQHQGGPPYFEGKIPPAMVSRVLNELEDSNFLDDPFLNVVNLCVDPPLTIISIIAANKVLCMEAPHGLRGDGVQGSKHYCTAYSRIRSLVGSLIPAQGKEVDCNYEIVRVSRFCFWED